MKMCVLIPHYNHGTLITSLLKKLAHYQLDCLIVDDGSEHDSRRHVMAAAKHYPWVCLLTSAKNHGKGGAVQLGLRYLAKQGYSHALQIDADGQHDCNDIPAFIKLAEDHPQAVINGQPIYDQSVPKARLHGRRITNFWVAVETRSKSITDAMCGYRLYPLAKTIPVLKGTKISCGMGFDIDIIVRLHWAGVPIIPFATKVIYPQDGLSHFKMFSDNVKISAVHTRLVCGMLWRLVTFKRQSSVHWSEKKEVGSHVGLKFMLLSYKLLGRRLADILLYPVITYFYWRGKSARLASRQYIQNLTAHYPDLVGQQLSSFAHFLNFGRAGLDKLAAWNHDIKLEHIVFNRQRLVEKNIAEKRGGVILTAHLGNIEIARALATLMPKMKVNALVFSENARKINAILQQTNRDFDLNLIEVTTIDSQLAMRLQQKVAEGEFIVIVADRTSTTQPGRHSQVQFLGYPAAIPQGPFILAGLLQCPVYFMLCVKEAKNQFSLVFEQFSTRLNIARPERQQALAQYSQRYANLLQDYCQQYPLQWFNFFDFWQRDEDEDEEDKHEY